MFFELFEPFGGLGLGFVDAVEFYAAKWVDCVSELDFWGFEE